MRKQKGSSNRRKQLIRVNAVYKKTTNRRNDFLHKLSRYYVDNYHIIGREKLSIKGLVQIACNARNIADASWGRFFNMLEYKAENACSLVVSPP